MNPKLKKIILIIILIAIIIGIVFVIINSSSGKKEEKTSNVSTITKETGDLESDTTEDEKELKPATITELSDGVKYSIIDEEITPEIILGDNYFDTQIADINLNFDQYEGKTIEIEGLYFENNFEDMKYTFVGRYSLSNICPTCPAGYSYFEYEWNGDKEIPATDSENWLKIKGTLTKGFDGVDYYYIDAQSIEIMNEKGLETVSN